MQQQKQQNATTMANVTTSSKTERITHCHRFEISASENQNDQSDGNVLLPV